jgi:hypothetical protein
MEALVGVNWWAVLISMVVAMGIGSLWYSQMLFGDIWQKELKIKAKEMGGNDPTAAMIGAALLTVIQAVTLAILIGGGDVLQGIYLAALVSVGVVAAAIGVQYCFEGRTLRLFAINAGYIVLSTVAMGAIIGAWH